MEFIALRLTVIYTQIERVQFLAKYRKFRYNRGNRC